MLSIQAGCTGCRPRDPACEEGAGGLELGCNVRRLHTAAQDESCVAGHLGERAARTAADEDGAGTQQQQRGEGGASDGIGAAAHGQNGSAASGHVGGTEAAASGAGSAEGAGKVGDDSSSGEDESSSDDAEAQEEQPVAHDR